MRKRLMNRLDRVGKRMKQDAPVWGLSWDDLVSSDTCAQQRGCGQTSPSSAAAQVAVPALSHAQPRVNRGAEGFRGFRLLRCAAAAPPTLASARLQWLGVSLEASREQQRCLTRGPFVCLPCPLPVVTHPPPNRITMR